MSEPCDLSAVEARRLIAEKALSPVELIESALRRIEAVNPTLNAAVAVDAEAARKSARHAEQRQMRGELLGLLEGLPVGVKDLDATAGLRTTWGSLIYKNHVPKADDPHIGSIRREGGIILAKTNTPEFGAGSNTTNKVYGATGNPFDPEKTCGGSSGGSAVALATGMVAMATGSDYGGSLRTPASFCGVVGFRPSPGIVPATARANVLRPFSVNGPMGRTVEDAHLLLRAEMGRDARDPFSRAPAGAAISGRLREADLSTLKAAFSADLGCAPIDTGIRRVFEAKCATFANVFRGTENRAPDLGRVSEAFEILRGLSCVEDHASRLGQHRDLLGANVIDNTERGLKLTATEIAWAANEQTALYHRFNAFFADVDVLIAPATAVSPFPHALPYLDEIDNQKLPNYMSWYTITWALTMALPSVVVLPAGLDHKGLPFGLQIIGPFGSDARVLSAALALERVLARHAETRRPLPDIAKLIAARPEPRSAPSAPSIGAAATVAAPAEAAAATPRKPVVVTRKRKTTTVK